jgi:hypothetical protein
VNVEGKTEYGTTACAAAIPLYKTTKGVPTPLVTKTESEATDSASCYEKND